MDVWGHARQQRGYRVRGGPEHARQRQRFKGQGRSVEHRGLLRDWDDTRLSPHLSMVTLECLDGGGERGGG